MQDLLSPAGLNELRRFLNHRPFLAFDFDGTLVPIADDRTVVQLSPLTAALLRRLSAASEVGVISGRSLNDLASRTAGLERLLLAGNHGGEVTAAHGDGAGSDALSSASSMVEELLARIRTAKELPVLPEEAIENKRMTVTFHWRRLPESEARAWAKRVREIAAELEGFRVLPGIQSLNLIPRGLSNKGEAVAELLRTTRRRGLLYVGDEETDEDVFRAAPGAPFLGVRVGASPDSAAQWFLQDQAEVDRLLEVLLALVAGTAAGVGAGTGVTVTGVGTGAVAAMEGAFTKVALPANREA